MVDTTKYVSEFIRADEIKEGDKALIIGEATYETGQFGEQLVAPVDYKKDQRKLNINRTNCDTLNKKWGSDSNKWVGGVIELSTYDVKIRKETKKAIEITPIGKAKMQSKLQEEVFVKEEDYS